jgi:hypothetical protein
MAESPSGTIRMSDKTYDIIKQNQFICDTLEFEAHKDVKIRSKVIPTYTCEQIFIGEETEEELNADV